MSAAPLDDPAEVAAHLAEVAAFRERRDARYRSPDGWLTLVERVPLELGDNPIALGVLRIEPGRPPRLAVGAGLAVTRRGAPLEGEVEVVADEAGVRGDVLELGGRRYDVFRRGDSFVLRGRDPDAPARLAFTHMPVFPVDRRWRVAAAFDALEPPRIDQVPHTDGTEGDAPCVGTARFSLEGRPEALAIYLEESTARLYTSFLDPSNARETYGGGRMLYTARPPPAGALILDFNMAFNPPCALNSLVSCPLPPPENRLTVAVLAGERRP